MVFGEVFDDQSGKSLVLLSTKVTGEFLHSYATLTYTQKFSNPRDQETNCTLFIKGGNDYVVYNVKALAAGKVITFVLKEIGEAIASYDEQVQNGSFAAIAREDQKDSIAFVLGNIPAKCELEITFDVSFVGFMSGPSVCSFRLPCKKELEEANIELDINYTSLIDIKNVTSTFGEGFGNIPTDSKSGSIKFATKSPNNQPEISFEYNSLISDVVLQTEIENETFIGFSLSPDLPTNQSIKSEVFLVIDCSGSMSGKPISVALDTLKLFIRSLPAGSYFNIVRFGSRFESLFPESVPYNKVNYDAALNQAEIMKADLGGTDLLSPISSIFQIKPKDGYVRQVFILTDGQVENEAEILALATAHRSTHRLFSLGIGKSISRSFIEELAKSSNGSSIFVEESSQIMVSVMSQLSASLRPAIVETQIHIEGTDSVELSPFPIPSLFSGSFNHIYSRIPKTASASAIMVTGKTGDKEYEMSIAPIVVPPKIRFDKLFAFFNIRDMEEKLTLANKNEIEILRQNAIKVSCQYGVVSQFTAMQSFSDGVETQVSSKESREETESSSRRKALRQNVSRTNNIQPPQRNDSQIKSVNVHLTERQTRGQSTFTRRQNVDAYDMFSSPQSEEWGSAVPKYKKMSKPVSKPKGGNQMTEIIDLQQFEGFWTQSDKNSILSTPVPKTLIPPVSVSPEVIETIYSTIVVLGFLEFKYKDLKDAWVLIEHKSLEWLNKQDSSIPWMAVIEAVASYLASQP